MLDTGAPWYDSYETADGQWLAIGAIEPQFYASMLEGLGLTDADLSDQQDTQRWPELRAAFAAAVKTRTRDEWERHFEGLDACVAPVLTPVEAPTHPHNVARHSFLELDGVPQPAPAPRFSRTTADTPRPPQHIGESTDQALADWGFDHEEITRLRDAGMLV
jgi:alpha-methylacyl-CoA racemase